MLNTKKDKSKRQSDLFFLKKSGNEKKIVNRIGEKIKSPIPGANNNPNEGTSNSEALRNMSDETRGILASKATVEFSEDDSYLKNGIIFVIK